MLPKKEKKKKEEKIFLCAFLLSKLDEYSSSLAGCPKYRPSKLQKVQNNAARFISEHPDPPTSLLCFIRFVGNLLSRGSKTSMLCFKIISLQALSTFQNFLLSIPAAPLFCRHPSVQIPYILPNKVQWSALFLLPGSNYLKPTPYFYPSFYLCPFF